MIYCSYSFIGISTKQSMTHEFRVDEGGYCNGRNEM